MTLFKCTGCGKVGALITLQHLTWHVVTKRCNHRLVPVTAK